VGAYAGDMDASCELYAGSDEQLDTAEKEHPCAGCAGGLVEEQNAADDEPDPNKNVVDDAQSLIPPANGEFVVSDVKSDVRIVVSLRAHADDCTDRQLLLWCSLGVNDGVRSGGSVVSIGDSV
jgi:hypothetical protein